MTRRQELLAIEHKLSALADDVPANISLSAAQCLANAAEAISNALTYAVDAAEIADLETRRHA